MTRTSARAAAAGQAEGDAAVVGEGQAQRAQHVDVLAGDEVRCRSAALAAWSTTTTRPQSAPARRQARAAAPLTLRSGRRRPPATPAAGRSPIIGLRSSANPPPPIGGRKRRKMLRYGLVVSATKSSTTRSAAAVGNPRHPGDQDVGEDQDDVDDEQRIDVIGHVPPSNRQRNHRPHPLQRGPHRRLEGLPRALAVERLEPGLGAAPGRRPRPCARRAGCRCRSSSAVPAVVSTTSSRAISSSKPAFAPASAIASTASAR